MYLIEATTLRISLLDHDLKEVKWELLLFTPCYSNLVLYLETKISIYAV